MHLKLNLFKIRTKNNINILFTKFIKKFPKFDLNYKCLEDYNYITVRLRTNLDRTRTEQGQNKDRTRKEQEQNRDRTGT